MRVRGWFGAMVLAGCAGPASSPPPVTPVRPAVIEPCIAAAGALERIFGDSLRPGTHEVARAAIADSCRANAWSEAATSCFAAGTNEDDLDACLPLLTKAQSDAAEAAVSPFYSDRSSIEPPSPPDAASPEPTTAAPPKRSRAPRDEGANPCEGGEANPCEGGE